MDAQDFRSLREAYVEVYNESYKDLGDKARDRGHQLLRQSLKTATSNRYAGTGPSNTPEGEKLMKRARNQFTASAFHDPKKSQEKEATNRARGERKKKAFGNRLTRSDRQGIRDSYEYDLYDIILSHLLDEGYAETPESAEAIMVNMSEEWRQSIVEGDALQNTIKRLEGKRDAMNREKPGSANTAAPGKQSVGAATYSAYQRLRGV